MNVPSRCLTVSELTNLIKGTLEQDFPDLELEGEISNLRPSSTGHLYFTLKDRDAVISAVMFKNRLGTLSFPPADGNLVKVRGGVSVYAKRGSYQIICEQMRKSGEGDILALLEDRKRRLAAEGLFDPVRKKPLPPFPEKIAVITSPTGAAIRDIMRVLKRRNAGMHLVILPAPVQGENAASILARQIRIANLHRLADVIILTRGGGSLEDLLPFSEEELVRAVAESSIPVISAVGHEIDWALTDYASDMRAPTPSAAAEMVSANMEDVSERIGYYKKQLINAVSGRVERIRLLLARFTPEQLERNFRILEQPLLQRLDDAKEGILYGLKNLAKDSSHRVELLIQKIVSASPKEILKKGYAFVTRDGTGTVVATAGELSPADEVKIQFLDGAARANITETIHEKL